MQNHFLTRTLLLGMLVVSTSAMAQSTRQSVSFRYRWTDDHGQVHYSDALNAQAIKNGYDELNNRGMVVNHVDRQLTPEERKAAALAKANADAAKAKAERQHSEDMQMLNAYPNERVFKDAQQAEVNELTQSLQTTQINLHSQEQNLADLLAHAADLKHANKPVPVMLQKRIDDQRTTVSQQRAELTRQEQAKQDAIKSMADKLARYRKLKAELDAGRL